MPRDFYRSGLQFCERCGRQDHGAFYIDGRWVCGYCQGAYEHARRRRAAPRIPWWRRVLLWLRDQA